MTPPPTSLLLLFTATSFFGLDAFYLNAQVANTEDVAFLAEPANLDVSPLGLLGTGRGQTSEGATLAGGHGVGDGHFWVKLAVSNAVPLSAVDKIVQLMKHRKIAVRGEPAAACLYFREFSFLFFIVFFCVFACVRDPN